MTAKFTNPFWRQEKAARDLLAKGKLETAELEIIRTGKDCILFAQDGKAWTAWLERDGTVVARLDPGFPAEY